MKRTIKMLLVSTLLATASAKTLTLSEVRSMYNTAVENAHMEAATDVKALQINYTIALRKYYRNLSDNAKTKEDLADLAIIKNELEQVADLKGKDLPAVDPNAGKELLKLRQAYKTARVAIEKSKEAKLVELKGTLSTTLAKLQKELLAKGETEKALQVFDAIVEVDGKPVDERVDISDPLKKSFMVITKKFGGYAHVKSNQKLKLVEGQVYTLEFFAQLGGKTLNEHDCLPRFYREEGEKDFEGGDKNEMRRAQRASEDRKVSNAGDGWSKITVKFTHSYNEDVVFGLVFYEGGSDININLRDFSLTDELGKELITKNLNTKKGWIEGDYNTFVK